MEEMTQEDTVRCPLDQQTSQCVIVDLSSPMTQTDLTMITDSLQRVIPLVCVLPGPPRIPLLSIIVCNNSTGIAEEVILGFGKVRGNFTRCFDAMRNLCTEFICTKHDRKSDSLRSAVQKALTMYQNALKVPNSDCDLELTIISSMFGYQIRKPAMDAIISSGVTRIKTVTIVTIQHDTKLSIDELEFSGEEEGVEAETSLDVQSRGADLFPIMYILIEPDKACSFEALTNHMMSWLSDRNKDSYHIQLMMPHPYTDGDELVLKFDTRELILPSSVLPFNNKVSLDVSDVYTKPPHMLSKAECLLKFSSPVHILTVIKHITNPAQLMPYLHSTPMVLEATQCWKVDWDDIDANRSHISALHSTLLSQNRVLICQASATDQELQPLPYYCIYPTNHCLIIQQVACKDLYLLHKLLDVKPDVKSSFQQNIDMEMTLKKIESADNFTPHQLEGSHLVRNITKYLLPKRYSSKKKPVTSTSAARRGQSAIRSKYEPLSGIVSPGDHRMDTESLTTQRSMSARKQSAQPTINKRSQAFSCSNQGRTNNGEVKPLLKLVPHRRRSETASQVKSGGGTYVPPSITAQLDITDNNMSYNHDETMHQRNSSNRWISRDQSEPLSFTTYTTHTQPIATQSPQPMSSSAANRRCWTVPSSYMETSPHMTSVGNSKRKLSDLSQNTSHPPPATPYASCIADENEDLSDFSGFLSPMDVGTCSQPQAIDASPLLQEKSGKFSEPSIFTLRRSPDVTMRVLPVQPLRQSGCENVRTDGQYSAGQSCSVNEDGILSPGGKKFDVDDYC